MAQIIGAYDTNVKTSQSALKKVTATTVGTSDGLDVNILAGAIHTEYADGTASAGGQKGTVVMGLDTTNSTLDFLRLDSSNNLNVNVQSGSITADIEGDYADDSAFTVDSDKGLAVGGVFTTDAVDSGDFGVFKINANRELAITVENTPSVSQSGTWDINDISGTISLPTGAATETTLALVETNTDALATVTKTTVGADVGLDVNVVKGINVEVDLNAADDSVLAYGFDGASNQKISTDASGHLQVDVLTEPARTPQIALNTDTGTGNINVQINLGATIKILGVKIHFAGVPTANDFVVTSNNLAGGPAYDTVLYKADPGTLGVTDLSFVPAGELIIEAGEAVTITFTNAGATLYGLTTTFETIV